jgi:[ribosomal protein S5]-alanine N-acetyltransferase
MMQLEDYFQPFPVLETNRTHLRMITDEDAEDMFNYCKNPEVSRYTVWDTHQSIEDTKQFIAFVKHRYESQRVGPWGVVDQAAGRMIGSCSFVNWDNRNRRAELGYVISHDYWNMGYMTEVIQRIIEFGFMEAGLIRIEARCHPDNRGSARVMEKCGMQYEGLLRRNIWAKGDYQDVKLYAIIRDDYTGSL